MSIHKKRKIHNFHVPLPEELYNNLKKEAMQFHMAATELARYAIAFWLKKAQKASLHKAISEYAAECAGTEFDLDKEFEKQSINLLLSKKGSVS